MLSPNDTPRPWDDVRASHAGRSADDWYLLRVMPGAEKHATEFFADEIAGSTTYYPVARRKRVVRHMEVVADHAAMQGYLYARFEGSFPNLEHIGRYCRATPRLIMRQDSNGEPRYLWERNSVIEDLRRREANNEFGENEKCPTISQLIGSQVRVPSGIFIGQYAKVHSIDNSIVKLKVWLLGRKSFISFCFDDLFTENGEMK